MAASNLNLGKASGGVLNVQPADGTTTTSIVLPASGTVTTNEYVNSNNLGNGSTTFNGFGGTGFKNILINGGFDLWQRGTSQTISSTSGVYLADRWVTFVSGGGTATTNQIQTRYSNGGSKNTIRLTYGATGQTLFLEQRIEGGALLMAGKTYTLSFDVIGVGVISLNIYSAESGTDLNITSSQIVPVTGTLTRQSITFTVGSSFTAGDISRYIRFMTSSGNGTVGNYFEIGRVQLEEGSVATPFEQRPYGLELSLCQRYYETCYPAGIARGTNLGNTPFGAFTWKTTSAGWFDSLQSGQSWFRVPKRVTPTMAYWDGAGNSNKVTVLYGSHNINVNLGSPFSNLSTNGFFSDVNVSTNSVNVFAYWEASAEL